MIKYILILLILTNSVFASVHVKSIAEYMIDKTNNEGNTGPGFFINTQEFSNVSKIMKQRLGIKETPKNQTQPTYDYSHNNNATNHNIAEKTNKNYKAKESFQNKVILFNRENTTISNNYDSLTHQRISFSQYKKNKKVH